MDCNKVGKLIFNLRRQKHMTQKQLADCMNISDKTISKWERGLGLPDVSLLHELSSILGVNIEKLLLGELSANSADGGNMKRVQFFVCPYCGNILSTTGKGEVSCCGRKMEPLKAIEADGAHTPNIEEVENDYYITFPHPMEKQHYLMFAAYVMIDRMLFVRLYPEQSPAVRIPQMRTGDLYVYCSDHGLMKCKL